MAQVLVRGLEDDLVDAYREAARSNARSLEAELREALRRARPMTSQRRDELVREADRIAAMTPPKVRQTPSEQLVREDRYGLRED